MKRLTSILLAAVMMFALVVPALAAGVPYVSVSSTSANAGDEVTLSISLDTQGITTKGCAIVVSASSGLTLTKMESTGYYSANVATGRIQFMYPSSTAGVSFTATFKVSAAATSGDYYVTASAVELIGEDYKNIAANDGMGKVAVHGHAAAGNWKTSSTHHWHTCSCGQEMDKALHTPGPAATVENPQVCTVCGYVLAPKLPEPHTHVYGEWTYYSTTQHIRECSCGSKELGDHILDENNLCTVCGHQFPQDIPDDPDEPGFVLDNYQLAQLLLLLRNRTYNITAKAGEGGSITPAGVTKVKYRNNQTYVITPNLGYVVDNVVVDGKDMGAIREYTFENVRGQHQITATFKPIPWVNPFTDVTADDWFYFDVAYVNYFGLMVGTSDTEFSPEDTATRGQIVTTLWRAEGCPAAESEHEFTDVAEEMYYAEAIAWAAENKIVEGHGDGIFGPDEAITREQIAAILHRYADYKALAEDVEKEAPDAYDHSEWAEENVAWAHESGLFLAIEEDISNLTDVASRAEIAAYLTRFCLFVLMK